MIKFLWEFIVKPDQVEKFLSNYGHRGAWVQLFSRTNGFVKSDLLRDIENPLRFVTVDYWESEESREAFMREFRNEYSRLDESCESLTDRETFLGTTCGNSDQPIQDRQE